MITYSPVSKSYIFDRGYCHKKINQSNSFVNFSWVAQSTQSEFGSRGKTIHYSRPPQNSQQF